MPFLTALSIMLQEENQMLTDTAYYLCTYSSDASLRYSLAIKLTCQAAKKSQGFSAWLKFLVYLRGSEDGGCND